MATRFYLPASGAAPVTVTPGSGWTVTTGSAAFALKSAKSNTAKALGTLRTKGSATANINQIDRQYISEFQVAAGSISGTFSMVLRAWESATALDARVQVIIRVVSADGATERGVLYAGSAAAVSAVVGDEAQELAGTAATARATRIKNALALSSVTAVGGDRIVVEIGARLGSTSTTTTFQNEYGDPSATADYALTAALTTDLVPWIEFSQTLTAYVPPTGGGGTVNPIIRSVSEGISSTTSMTAPKPAGLDLDDYILALHAAEADNTGLTASGFSALTSQAPTSGTNIPAATIWGKVATSTDVAASTFAFGCTSSATPAQTVTMLAIQKGTYDPATPITFGSWRVQTRGTAGTGTTLQTADSMTGVVAGMLLALFATDANGNAQTYPSTASGMDLVNDVQSASGYSLQGIYEVILAAAGATGAKTVTPTGTNTSNGCSSIQAVINPGIATDDTTHFFISAAA